MRAMEGLYFGVDSKLSVLMSIFPLILVLFGLDG